MKPQSKTVISKKSHSLRAGTLIVALSLMAFVAPNQAQAEPSDEALMLMREGSKYFALGEYEAARDAFEKSYQLHPAFEGACSLGQTYAKLDNMPRAAFFYGECVSRFPHGGDREKLKVIRTDQAEILKKVGRVRVAAEAGLAVEVDGEAVGTTPVEDELYVEPGEHLIEAKRADGAEASERFVVDSGELVRVRVPDVRLAADATPEPEITPHQEAPERGSAAEVEKKRHNWVPAYVLGGLSVAALGTSVGLRVAAGTKKSKVEDLKGEIADGECSGLAVSTECNDLEDESRSHRKLAVSSNVLLIGGAALGAGAVGWLIYELTKTDGSKDGRNGLLPVFMIGSSGAQVELRGSF